MPFEPDKITRQHILDAVAKIEHENIDIVPSTKFDVIVGNKLYPPKEVMRFAHQLMNGEHIWERSGGEPTNRYLSTLGFQIVPKTENNDTIESSFNLVNLLRKIGKEKATTFFSIAASLVSKLEIDSDDDRLTFGTSKYVQLSITIGQRYCLALRPQEENPYQFILKENVPENENLYVSKYDGNPIAYYGRSLNIDDYALYLNQIVSASKIELDRSQLSGFRKSNNIYFEKAVFDEKYRQELFEQAFGKGDNINDKTQKENVMQSKNIILYGPPGTGKTYNSIDKAVQIALGKSSLNHDENKKQFDELRKLGQIEFVTFHQNYSYEDFIVGIRPNVSENTGSLTFVKHYGIFYEIAQRAKENYLASFVEKGKLINTRDLINNLLDRLRNGEEIKLKTSSNVPFAISYYSEGTIQLIYQNGSKNNTLSVDTLAEITDGKREYTSSLRSYFYPVRDFLLLNKVDVKTEKESLKNFVLVIDEINRANISKVFGELITLLEEDKRLGGENQLKITLPNGEKEFGVPPNLYIIGTMNTADKSIALIDIALRRRFEFLGYYPIYDGYDLEASVLLKKINAAIFKEKKSGDYLIGHAYFMKKQPLTDVLQNKVIPLLMEYFSGKTELVERIFSDTDWTISFDIDNYTWKILRK